jgi:DnaJ-class molecular chaperone
MAFTIQGEGAEGDSKQAPKGDLLVQVRSSVHAIFNMHCA